MLNEGQKWSASHIYLKDHSDIFQCIKYSVLWHKKNNNNRRKEDFIARSIQLEIRRLHPESPFEIFAFNWGLNKPQVL